MVERILQELSRGDFDFRNYAHPADPLSNLFDEWVPYYRLKYAIAKALRAESILEIGVRFGYSAMAFLTAVPEAKFTGIGLNGENFAGQRDAREWAKRVTSGYDAKFLVADMQTLRRSPGGRYHLIHVDGQQDGTGTFHNLRRAIAQAPWVLLDRYFRTRENVFNANGFLLK
ncbi:MAG: class I SAM-dependent methyltransferase [Verrucomicrobiota bacterium]|nr:class I SAM-dependent methyltransferase [Verrucomicrobiota bacterium]